MSEYIQTKHGNTWKGGRSIDYNGYVTARCPGHTRANSTGRVYEHILVAEKALGVALPCGVEIHHVNEVRSDNRGSNLVICQDHAYHSLLHLRAKAHKACGHVEWLKCGYCKQYDAPSNIAVSTHHKYHRACAAKYQMERQNG